MKGFTLEGTDQCQDASDLYIEVPRPTNVSEKSHDPLQNPDFGFYIYHAKDKRRGIKLYLCSDPDDESTVRLVTRIPSPNAYSRLYVEFPSTQALAPVSRWSKESMHLLRKTAYRKRRQYIFMNRTDTSMKLFFSSEQDALDPQSLCRFTIRNASEKCGVDSNGDKKTCNYCQLKPTESFGVRVCYLHDEEPY